MSFEHIVADLAKQAKVSNIKETLLTNNDFMAAIVPEDGWELINADTVLVSATDEMVRIRLWNGDASKTRTVVLFQNVEPQLSMDDYWQQYRYYVEWAEKTGVERNAHCFLMYILNSYVHIFDSNYDFHALRDFWNITRKENPFDEPQDKLDVRYVVARAHGKSFTSMTFCVPYLPVYNDPVYQDIVLRTTPFAPLQVRQMPYVYNSLRRSKTTIAVIHVRGNDAHSLSPYTLVELKDRSGYDKRGPYHYARYFVETLYRKDGDAGDRTFFNGLKCEEIYTDEVIREIKNAKFGNPYRHIDNLYVLMEYNGEFVVYSNYVPYDPECVLDEKTIEVSDEMSTDLIPYIPYRGIETNV